MQTINRIMLDPVVETLSETLQKSKIESFAK